MELARQVVSECAVRPALLTRQASQQDRQRGADHERAVLQWAAARWPRHEVLANCHVVAGVARGSPSPHVKAEFDAMVVTADGADCEHGRGAADGGLLVAGSGGGGRSAHSLGLPPLQ